MEGLKLGAVEMEGLELGAAEGLTLGAAEGIMLRLGLKLDLEGVSEGIMLKLGPTLGTLEGVSEGAPEVSLSMQPQHTSFAVLPFVP
jgi:hypothetical protein